MQILHEIDFKKRMVDELEESHLPIYFDVFGDKEWSLMKELEETFYFPPKDNEDNFQVWMPFGPVGFMKFDGTSKEDGTKTTAVWRMGLMMCHGTSVFFLIRKNQKLRKRLDFVFKKHGVDFSEPTYGPNKGFLKSQRKKTRDPIESRLRHEVFKRDGYKCIECGKTNKDTTLHVDHILPVAQGGKDELENLQTLCQACNLAKSNKCWNAQK